MTSNTSISSPKVELKETHSLTLKVMRMTKPSFKMNLPIYLENTDFLDNTIPQEQPSLPTFGVSQILSLPLGMGQINLGETFSSYISVHNDSPFDVTDVIIKVELQVTSSRFVLLDISNSPIKIFHSGESSDYVVHHEIKEAGANILICTVVYTKHDDEKKRF